MSWWENVGIKRKLTYCRMVFVLSRAPLAGHVQVRQLILEIYCKNIILNLWSLLASLQQVVFLHVVQSFNKFGKTVGDLAYDHQICFSGVLTTPIHSHCNDILTS